MFRECIWMKTVQKAKALFLVEKLIILKVLYPFCTVSISEWNCVNKWTYLLFLDAKWKNARSIDIHSGQLYYTEYLLERCKLSSVKFRPRMSLQNAIASSTFANRQKSITKKLQQRTRQSTKCCVLQTRNDHFKKRPLIHNDKSVYWTYFRNGNQTFATLMLSIPNSVKEHNDSREEMDCIW